MSQIAPATLLLMNCIKPAILMFVINSAFTLRSLLTIAISVLRSKAGLLLCAYMLPSAFFARPLALQVVGRGFHKPLHIVFSAGDPGAMYVCEQGGRIYRVEQAKKRRLFADLSRLVHKGGGEEGLLGMALAPKYNLRASYFYVNYTAGRPAHSYVARIPVKKGRAYVRKRHIILKIAQPYRNHNGGMILFGPEGYLYIATGDGGAAGDPKNYAQNRSSLLGKILRIQVPQHSLAKKAYRIPADNPFASASSLSAGFRKEIYAWGLRNPWRFSFDAKTGLLYAADVGQNRQEEVNLIEKGKNYGWRIKEGRLCYVSSKQCRRAAAKLADPIHVYGRKLGQSITGGYVYRGKLLSKYIAWYFFADYVSQRLWAFPLRAGGRRAGKARLLFAKAGAISSFGEDPQGELYLAEHRRGYIYKLVPGPL